jgi:hypothetical protein
LVVIIVVQPQLAHDLDTRALGELERLVAILEEHHPFAAVALDPLPPEPSGVDRQAGNVPVTAPADAMSREKSVLPRTLHANRSGDMQNTLWASEARLRRSSSGRPSAWTSEILRNIM